MLLGNALRSALSPHSEVTGVTPRLGHLLELRCLASVQKVSSRLVRLHPKVVDVQVMQIGNSEFKIDNCQSRVRVLVSYLSAISTLHGNAS